MEAGSLGSSHGRQEQFFPPLNGYSRAKAEFHPHDLIYPRVLSKGPILDAVMLYDFPRESTSIHPKQVGMPNKLLASSESIMVNQ